MIFTIQTGNTLPVFIPRVVLGQDDAWKTIYTVALKYTYQGIEYVSIKNVYYEPEDATAPIPAPPLSQQDFSSKFYCVYNYTHVVRLVNIALETAFATLCDKVPTDDASPNCLQPLHLTWTSMFRQTDLYSTLSNYSTMRSIQTI